jgi:hypothetical protein
MLCDRVILLSCRPAPVAADIGISSRAATLVEAYQAAAGLMLRLELEQVPILRLA